MVFLSKFLAERVATPLADVAAGWVSARLGEGGERLAQARIMRVLLAGALVAPLAVLPLLALTLPLTLALPAAVAVAAAFLGCAACLNLTASRWRTACAVLLAAAAATACLTLAVGTEGKELTIASIVLLAALAGLLTSRADSAAAASPEAALPAPAGIADDRLIAHLPGLVTVHDEKGAVTRVGGADRGTFLGWMKSPLGRGFIDQIHVSDRIAFLSALDSLRLGGDRVSVEFRMHRRPELAGGDARQFAHVATDLIAIREDDAPLLILAQSRDAGASVALRHEAERLAARADGAETEKTRFLAAVSHEMRTPLNAILGFSEILSHEYFGRFTDERQREYVDLIHQSGSHLLSVVNTMLDMSKIEAGRYHLIAETFAVEEVVAACRKMLALQADAKGLSLTTRVTRNCGEVAADRRAVQQVLINLIGNAIKFTEAGGIITVDAERRGPTIRLTVSDTGIGIETSVLARLGQPFVQAGDAYARSHDGAGLGLCLVKGLVDLHGGSLTITSDAGEGTRVTIDLPADGSGIDINERNFAGDGTIDFPPRLKTMEHEPRYEDDLYDATAKTA